MRQIDLTLPSQWPYELGTIIITILEMRKLRFGEEKESVSKVTQLVSGKAGS